MLYRISLDKEDIKFCTAPSDKVRSARHRVSARVERRPAGLVVPRRQCSLRHLRALPGPAAPVCVPALALTPALAAAQIAALKDYKDKVKPVFLFYKVRAVFAAARCLAPPRRLCCLLRAGCGENSAALARACESARGRADGGACACASRKGCKRKKL